MALMYFLSALKDQNATAAKNTKKIVSEERGNMPTPVIFSK